MEPVITSVQKVLSKEPFFKRFSVNRLIFISGFLIREVKACIFPSVVVIILFFTSLMHYKTDFLRKCLGQHMKLEVEL